MDILEALQHLDEFGRAYEAGEDASLPPVSVLRSLRRNPSDFSQCAMTLSEPSLRRIIKAYDLLSRMTKETAFRGSVSACGVLFEQYASRFPESESALCAWVVQNRTNPYHPFGTSNDFDARSMAEFNERRAEQADRARKNQAKEMVRHQEKLERERVRAQENLPAAIRRGDKAAIEALLAKGARMPDEQ